MASKKGYGSVVEIKNNWTYTDLLKIVYYEDLQVIHQWNYISENELFEE
jgi:hypothetical protein